MIRTIRRELDALSWLLRTATLAAIAGALYEQLRRPPDERTWHGRLLGYVPYDFRMPTPRRLLDAYWNPSSDRIFTDQAFGVGWAVNLPAAIGLARRTFASTSTTTRSKRRAS